MWLSDERLVPLASNCLQTKPGYGWAWEMLKLGREKRGGWKLHFLLPMRYLHEVSQGRKRWQLKVCSGLGIYCEPAG